MILIISVLANRLAGKYISNMTYLVSSRTLNVDSIICWLLESESGASIPMGQGTCPPIFIKGGIHGNVPPQYFISDVV